MIDEKSIRHKRVKELYLTGRSRRISGELLERAREGLMFLGNAQSLDELRAFRHLRLHPLKGGRKGRWAIKVSGPWRFTFRFSKETVFDLDLEQYH